jgi:hypothetical protein
MNQLLFLGDDQRRGVGERDEAQRDLVGLWSGGLCESAARERGAHGAHQRGRRRHGAGILEDLAAAQAFAAVPIFHEGSPAV